MHVRCWLFFLCIVGAGLLASRSGQAQCLPLELLDQGIAAGRITPDSVEVLMEPGDGKWQIHRGPNPYWVYQGFGEAETSEEKAQAWVGLRRSNQQSYYDLVYKTQQRSCIVLLRNELRRRAKLKSEPVNCVQCEGERLVGAGYTVTIFNQKASYLAKRTTYPYVLVIRRTAGVIKAGALLPDVSSRYTGDH